MLYVLTTENSFNNITNTPEARSLAPANLKVLYIYIYFYLRNQRYY